nr:GRIP [Hymenolepis microstoma]
MQQLLDERTSKIERYETKLKDIIAAYKKLQSENESLSRLLRSSELNESRLRKELDEKSKIINNQSVEISDLNGKLKNLVLEKNRYRDKADKIPSLNGRIDQLTRDLESEQLSSKSLKFALTQAQEQHEISTQHFETRISDIVATLQTYQEIHNNDAETISQLRLEKSSSQNKESLSPQTIKPSPSDLILTILESRNNADDASGSDELFDYLGQFWRAIVESSQIQQPTFEKQLLQRLNLKYLVSIESLETCEKERALLQDELGTVKVRLQSFHENTKKAVTSPLLTGLTSPKEIFLLESGANGDANKRELELQLQEAQDHIKLLRKQNFTTLLELESVRKSMLSKLAAADDEAAERLLEANSRHEAQLARMESEARRYREQTLSLLTEKEEEISELRTALFLANQEGSFAVQPNSRSRFSTTPTTSVSLSEGSCKEEAPDSTTLSPASAVNFDESFLSKNSLHCGLVHCAERHGRMVIEMKRLRASKRELEQRIEELEARLREERKVAAMEAAQDSRRTDGSSSQNQLSGEDVNVAYVKNVVFNLITNLQTSSLASRMAVVKALSMALRFTPEEESALIGGIIG